MQWSLRCDSYCRLSPHPELTAQRGGASTPSSVRFTWPLSGASPSDDDLYEKTTVTMLQRDSPNTMFVDSYGLHGFTVNGNRVIGPCAIIPHAIIQWNVGSWKDISEESLSLFYLLEPRIEILVLGTGDRVERLDPQLLRFMTRQGVAVEVQDTPVDGMEPTAVCTCLSGAEVGLFHFLRRCVPPSPDASSLH
ncbi:NADH dehydrogenase [ubiquinone] 1 alpha subcomplex assembly factor 3 isoform X2 [Lampetra fluviatilis]